MPGLNHRGPEGEGPRTGRGLGDCGQPKDSQANTATTPRNTFQPGRGRGLGRRKPVGRGRGLGRGLRNGRGRNI